MTLAKTLQALRKRQRLTQAGLAERSGVSARTIGEIESGAQRHPRDVTLRLLFEALGVGERERERLADALRDPNGLAARARLPTRPDALVGREVELTKLEDALLRGESRLLTLVGPGGVGKTSLAIEAARRCAGAVAGATRFIDAQPLDDFTAVRDAVLGAFGLATDETAIWPTHPEALVVIDNFEHLAASAPSLATLVEGVTFARFLVTSRETLRLRCERVMRVEPLELRAATELFAARAGRLNLEEIVRADDSLVRAVCEKLDRLPLAIELAVPRLRFVTLQRLAAELEGGIGTIATTLRDVPGRHHSMHRAIEASYRLLSDSERSALRALATFRGGATIAGLAAIADVPGEETRAHVESLESKSLLRVRTHDGAARAYVLETVREFAAERAFELGETELFAERHARFTHATHTEYFRLACTPESSWALRALTSDRENARAALAWAMKNGESELGMDLVFCENLDGNPSGTRERREALDLMLESLAEDHPRANELRMKADWTRGHYAFLEHDLAASNDFFERASRRSTDTSQAYGLNVIDPPFIVLFELGAYERALDLGRRALERRRADGNAGSLGMTLTNVGVLAMFADRLEEAGTCLAEAARIHEEIGSPVLASSLRNLAAWAVRSGDLEAAVAYARLAEAALPFDSPVMRMHLAVVFGEIALASDEPSRALEHLARALDLGLDIGNTLARTDTCLAMSRVAEAFAALDRSAAARIADRLARDLYAFWSIRIFPYEARRMRPLGAAFAAPGNAPERTRPLLRSSVTARLAAVRADIARLVEGDLPSALARHSG